MIELILFLFLLIYALIIKNIVFLITGVLILILLLYKYIKKTDYFISFSKSEDKSAFFDKVDTGVSIFFDEVNTGVIVIEKKTDNVIIFNKTAKVFFGIEKNTIAGENIQSFFKLIGLDNISSNIFKKSLSSNDYNTFNIEFDSKVIHFIKSECKLGNNDMIVLSVSDHTENVLLKKTMCDYEQKLKK